MFSYMYAKETTRLSTRVQGWREVSGNEIAWKEGKGELGVEL